MAREPKASFTLVKAALFYTGVTPNTPGQLTLFSSIRRTVPLLAVAHYIYCIIILIVSIYQKRDDLEGLTIYVGNLCFRIVVLFKFGTLYMNQDRAEIVIREIELIFNDLVRGDVKIEKGMRIMRALQVMAFCFWMFIDILVLLHLPEMFASRSLDVFYYHPYDITKSPMCEITIIAEVIFAMLGYGYVMLVDCAFLVVLVHLVAIARSLSKRILEIRDSAKKSTGGLNVVRRPNIADSHQLQIHDSPFVPTSSLHSQLLSNRPMNGRRRKAQQVVAEQQVMKQPRHHVVPSKQPHATGIVGFKVVAQAIGRTKHQEAINTAMEQILAKCVQQHQRLIRLIQEVNSVIKMAIVIQLFVNFLTGLFVLYVTTFANKFDQQELLILFLSFCLYMELFVCCLLADILTEYSLEVGDAAYCCDWFNTSELFKHGLRMIITRSQRALYIEAAGIPLSRRTFRTMCRAGYYLHMMLSNFHHGVKIVGQTQ